MKLQFPVKHHMHMPSLNSISSKLQQIKSSITEKLPSNKWMNGEAPLKLAQENALRLGAAAAAATTLAGVSIYAFTSSTSENDNISNYCESNVTNNTNGTANTNGTTQNSTLNSSDVSNSVDQSLAWDITNIAFLAIFLGGVCVAIKKCRSASLQRQTIRSVESGKINKDKSPPAKTKSEDTTEDTTKGAPPKFTETPPTAGLPEGNTLQAPQSNDDKKPKVTARILEFQNPGKSLTREYLEEITGMLGKTEGDQNSNLTILSNAFASEAGDGREGLKQLKYCPADRETINTDALDDFIQNLNGAGSFEKSEFETLLSQALFDQVSPDVAQLSPQEAASKFILWVNANCPLKTPEEEK